MSIKFFSRLALVAIIAAPSVNAMRTSIEANLDIRTKYSNCQPKAQKVIELTLLYMQAAAELKPAFLAELEKKKKKLKKCEKKNKKGEKALDISPIIFTTSISF